VSERLQQEVAADIIMGQAQVGSLLLEHSTVLDYLINW
jgi:hypothetical protein